MSHPALVPGAVAVVTGGASGIGLTAARRFAAFDLHVCIVDLGADRIAGAVADLLAGAPGGVEIAGFEVDVSDRPALVALKTDVADRFGGTDVLMNNAAIQIPTDAVGPEAD